MSEADCAEARRILTDTRWAMSERIRHADNGGFEVQLDRQDVETLLSLLGDALEALPNE